LSERVNARFEQFVGVLPHPFFAAFRFRPHLLDPDLALGLGRTLHLHLHRHTYTYTYTYTFDLTFALCPLTFDLTPTLRR
jgi:hypothetical protein